MRTAEELRRLDALVASRILGISRDEWWESPEYGWNYPKEGRTLSGELRHYTTDATACQSLKDKARADGWLMAMRLSGAGNFWTQIWKNGEGPHTTMKNGDASESSELIAWVLACLRAYGVKA